MMTILSGFGRLVIAGLSVGAGVEITRSSVTKIYNIVTRKKKEQKEIESK